MKTLTSLLTLLAIAGTLFFHTQKAQAQFAPTMPTVKVTKTLANTTQPRLTSLTTAGRTHRNLGSRKSPLLEVAATLGALMIADIAVGTVVGLGNMYAAIAGSGQFGWGVVGTLFFGAHSLIGLAFLESSSTVGIGVTMFLISGLMTALSIWNVAAGLSKPARSHYRRRRYYQRNRELGPFGKTGKANKPLLNAAL